MSGWFDLDDPPVWVERVVCIGLCLTGHDIGVPSNEIAYAHPDCLMHWYEPNGLNEYLPPLHPTDKDDHE